jgi:hypothetical protein
MPMNALVGTEAGFPAASGVKTEVKLMRRSLAFLLVAVMLVPLLAAGTDTALADRGNGRGKGSVKSTEAPTTYVSVPDGVYGGSTTAVAYPGGNDVYVFVQCYAPDFEGRYIYAAYFQVDENNQVEIGPFWSTLWPNSGAACTAEEGYFTRDGFGKWKALASTTFNVMW